MTVRSRLLAGCALAWAATALPALAQTAEPPPPEVIVVVPAPAPTPAPTPAPAPEPVIVVTDPNAGRFDALPPGERKIVQSLYDAQTGTTALSRDDIAAAKGTQGWGQVFRGMQADGLVQQRNLGQVVSGGRHAAALAPTPVTVSYGNGATATGGTVAVKGGHRHSATGVTTASGGAGAGFANTHGNSSHGHAAGVAASATNAAGGNANGHGGGGNHGKKH